MAADFSSFSTFLYLVIYSCHSPTVTILRSVWPSGSWWRATIRVCLNWLWVAIGGCHVVVTRVKLGAWQLSFSSQTPHTAPPLLLHCSSTAPSLSLLAPAWPPEGCIYSSGPKGL